MEIQERKEGKNTQHITLGEMLFGGRYVVLRFIGYGAFASVYAASDQLTHQTVAIKVMLDQPKSKQLFENEINFLSLINTYEKSETIKLSVTYLNSFSERNMLFIVMEHGSKSLFEVLQKNFKGINLLYIKKIAWQLLIFLKRLEDIGIMHTDLKPGNIMIDDTKTLKVMVVDFNSSVFLEGVHYSLAQSLYYRSPEVCLGCDYGLAVDIWSLGCIIFELHHGTPLLACKDEHRLLVSISTGTIPDELITQGRRSHQYFTMKNNTYELNQNDSLIKGKLEWHFKMETSLPEKWRGVPGHSLEDYQCYVDLLYKMLAINPSKRIRPLEALMHPFFITKLPQQMPKLKLKALLKAIPYSSIKAATPEQLDKLFKFSVYFIEVQDLSPIEGDLSITDPNDSFQYKLIQSIISEPHNTINRMVVRHKESRALSNGPQSMTNGSSLGSSSNKAEDQKDTTPHSYKMSTNHDKAIPPWPTSFGLQFMEYKKRLWRRFDANKKKPNDK